MNKAWDSGSFLAVAHAAKKQGFLVANSVLDHDGVKIAVMVAIDDAAIELAPEMAKLFEEWAAKNNRVPVCTICGCPNQVTSPGDSLCHHHLANGP